MPEHVLMSEIEIITDGGRRRRWSAAEKLRIVEETLDERESISGRHHLTGRAAVEGAVEQLQCGGPRAAASHPAPNPGHMTPEFDLRDAPADGVEPLGLRKKSGNWRSRAPGIPPCQLSVCLR
jgi:hypothetical protein